MINFTAVILFLQYYICICNKWTSRPKWYAELQRVHLQIDICVYHWTTHFICYFMLGIVYETQINVTNEFRYFCFMKLRSITKNLSQPFPSQDLKFKTDALTLRQVPLCEISCVIVIQRYFSLTLWFCHYSQPGTQKAVILITTLHIHILLILRKMYIAWKFCFKEKWALHWLEGSD